MKRTREDLLDKLTDDTSASSELATELFSVADEIESHPDFGRALTDPGLDADSRQELAVKLLGGRLSAAAVSFIGAAVGFAWSGGRDLAGALEHQATRIALKSSDTARVRAQVTALYEALSTHNEFRAQFTNPAGTAESRIALATHLLTDKADHITVQLVDRVVRSAEQIPAKLWALMELTSQLEGHLLARVTVARQLPADQAAELAKQLNRIYKTDVDIAEHIDSGVLGGARVELGDDVIDGTVVARLNQAQREFA